MKIDIFDTHTHIMEVAKDQADTGTKGVRMVCKCGKELVEYNPKLHDKLAKRNLNKKLNLYIEGKIKEAKLNTIRDVLNRDMFKNPSPTEGQTKLKESLEQDLKELEK